MAKARKLPSGSWRALVFAGYDQNRKRIYESFTAPTKKEAEFLAAEFAAQRKIVSKTPSNIILADAIDNYIQSKNNILSPTTIASYKKIKRYSFQGIMNLPLKKITPELMQEAVNTEAKRKLVTNPRKTVSPKTVCDSYGLICSVIKTYVPSWNSHSIRLPQRERKFKELIPPETIMKVVAGTSIELPVLLAMWLSFTMSEIRGLTKSKSIDGDFLTIQEVIVDVENNPVKKSIAKNPYRNRRHRIPPYIRELIEKTDPQEDYLVPLTGNTIYKRWSRLLAENDLPHMSFHDLRHVNASVMALLRVPDKYAQERGGWKTDTVMKSVYQHTFSSEREAVDDLIDEFFLKKMQHEMQHKK